MWLWNVLACTCNVEHTFLFKFIVKWLKENITEELVTWLSNTPADNIDLVIIKMLGVQVNYVRVRTIAKMIQDKSTEIIERQNIIQEFPLVKRRDEWYQSYMKAYKGMNCCVQSRELTTIIRSIKVANVKRRQMNDRCIWWPSGRRNTLELFSNTVWSGLWVVCFVDLAESL